MAYYKRKFPAKRKFFKKRRTFKRKFYKRKVNYKRKFNKKRNYKRRSKKGVVDFRANKVVRMTKSNHSDAIQIAHGWGLTHNEIICKNLQSIAKECFGEVHQQMSKSYRHCRITKVAVYYSNFNVRIESVLCLQPKTDADDQRRKMYFSLLDMEPQGKPITVNIDPKNFIFLPMQSTIKPNVITFIDNRQNLWDGSTPSYPMDGKIYDEENCKIRKFYPGKTLKCIWYPRMRRFPCSDYETLKNGNFSDLIRSYPECRPQNHAPIINFTFVQPQGYDSEKLKDNAVAHFMTVTFTVAYYVHVEYSGKEPNLHDY